MVFFFTNEVWKTFIETAYDRAKYLRDLYVEQDADSTQSYYLDIGAGLGYNSFLWGNNAKEIVAVDLSFPDNTMLKSKKNASLVIADARFLPFKNEVFDRISLFSVIEHVAPAESALKESFRVSKQETELIIQVPNRFFPLELHSGLPFVFYIPSKLRAPLLESINYGWVNQVDIPTVKRLTSITLKVCPEARITTKKVIYPPSVIWSKLRSFYTVIQKLYILNSVPLGYLLIIKK
jgi:ubiquinone/menaquinone biosynthesis C-methylase UbiE